MTRHLVQATPLLGCRAAVRLQEEAGVAPAAEEVWRLMRWVWAGRLDSWWTKCSMIPLSGPQCSLMARLEGLGSGSSSGRTRLAREPKGKGRGKADETAKRKQRQLAPKVR